jgi:hypothetical protein
MERNRTPQEPMREDPDFDLDNLLHPAQAFEHPAQVVHDPDLTLNEKRAILASWASDACAVEAAPALRRPPGLPEPVRYDDVIDALHELDRYAREHGDQSARYRRVVRRERLGAKRSDPRDGNRGQGQSLN